MNVMSLFRTLFRSSGLAGLAILASCGNSVSLDPARRAEASKIRVERQVARPAKLSYTDAGAAAAAMPLAITGGLVGGLAGGAIAEGMNAGNRDELERMIAGTVGDAGKPLREAMAAALKRKKCTTVTETGAKSRLALEYTTLGLMPLQTFSSEMQIIMEVEATLTANDGTVIWRTNSGSYPHNDQLPVRTMDEYRAQPALFGQDLEATCAWVADSLADYLKWEMVDE
jgi:hypothetical protein